MSSPQPVVPLDVVHCIFDQLQDPHDAASLSACSRACKLWLPLARKFLSAEMPVKLIGAGEDGEVQRRDTWGTSYSDWVEWYGFLKPQCVVLTAVKRLKISSMSPGFARVKPEDLAVIIPCLPRLQQISIADATLECPHPFQEPFLPSLRSLALRNITASMQHTVNFLRCLPAAQRVFFEDLKISRPGRILPITPGERMQPSAIAPQSLCFAHIRKEKRMQNLVDFYVETNARETLRYLEFRNFAYGGLKHFLQQMQNLETIVLSAPDSRGQHNEPFYQLSIIRMLRSLGTALASVHTLRRLALNIPCSSCAPSTIVPLRYATPALQEVEIHVALNEKYPGIAELPRLLQRFEDLRHVKIVLLPDTSESHREHPKLALSGRILLQELKEGMRKEVPDLTARGIVEVIEGNMITVSFPSWEDPFVFR